MLAGASSALAQQPARASATPTPVEVDGFITFVRGSAGGNVIGWGFRGHRFAAHGQSSGWVAIDWGGREAWLQGSHVAARQADLVTITASGLNVRTGPSVGDRRIGLAHRDETYVKLAERGAWLRIQFDHRKGWVHGAYTTPATSAPAPTPPAPPATPPAPPAPTPAPPTPTPPAPAPPAPAPTPTPPAPTPTPTPAPPSTGPASLLAERVGFGASTTGGDPGRIYRVTTLADDGAGSLRRAVESREPYWIVFGVSGTIRLRSDLRVRSNKTVDGRGRDVTVRGGWRFRNGVENVIVSDLRLTNPDGDDVINVWGEGGARPSDFENRDLWFHHLEVFDSNDGLLDIRGGTNVTISWCHFRRSLKALLLWKDSRQQYVAGMRITMHHNFFDRVTRRGPSFHAGLMDYFNNYQKQWYEYGAASYASAQFLSESNIYEARPGSFSFESDPNPGGDRDLVVSKHGLINDWANRPFGFIKSVNDSALNGAELTEHEPRRVFDRATYYQATVQPVDATLRDAIVNGAGPR